MMNDTEHELAIDAVMAAFDRFDGDPPRSLVSDILGTVEALADGNGPTVADCVAYLNDVVEGTS